MSQLTSNQILIKAIAAGKFSGQCLGSLINAMKTMPLILKQATAIIAAGTFTATLSLTIVTLAPDKLDHERKSELELQYRARSADLHAEN